MWDGEGFSPESKPRTQTTDTQTDPDIFFKMFGKRRDDEPSDEEQGPYRSNSLRPKRRKTMGEMLRYELSDASESDEDVNKEYENAQPGPSR